MRIFNSVTLNALSSQAKENPRHRQNLNLHTDYNERCQRLLNAIEPDSYIRPHRHLAEPKPECFIGIRGRLALLIFNEEGDIEHVFPFGPKEETAGADLNPGIWHTVICLEEGSVFFETKPGPFTPMSEQDMASWAPCEGSPEAKSYLEGLRQAVCDWCGTPEKRQG